MPAVTQRDLDALRRGDPEACEAIYREHLADVLRLLHRGFVYHAAGQQRFFQVASAFDREELCQEAFCEFFRQCQAGRFDTRRPVRPYLRRIVINLALQNVRRLYREISRAEPADAVEGFEPPDTLEQQEIVALMTDFRAALPAQDRALLKLYVEEKRSQRVVGERLGMSRDQVYRRLMRIRERAATFLKTKGWLDDP